MSPQLAASWLVTAAEKLSVAPGRTVSVAGDSATVGINAAQPKLICTVALLPPWLTWDTVIPFALSVNATPSANVLI